MRGLALPGGRHPTRTNGDHRARTHRRPAPSPAGRPGRRVSSGSACSDAPTAGAPDRSLDGRTAGDGACPGVVAHLRGTARRNGLGRHRSQRAASLHRRAVHRGCRDRRGRSSTRTIARTTERDEERSATRRARPDLPRRRAHVGILLTARPLVDGDIVWVVARVHVHRSPLRRCRGGCRKGERRCRERDGDHREDDGTRSKCLPGHPYALFRSGQTIELTSFGAEPPVSGGPGFSSGALDRPRAKPAVALRWRGEAADALVATRGPERTRAPLRP